MISKSVIFAALAVALVPASALAQFDAPWVHELRAQCEDGNQAACQRLNPGRFEHMHRLKAACAHGDGHACRRLEDLQ